MESTTPLSEKSYTAWQSLPGELIKKSERELMEFTTAEPQEEATCTNCDQELKFLYHKDNVEHVIIT